MERKLRRADPDKGIWYYTILHGVEKFVQAIYRTVDGRVFVTCVTHASLERHGVWEMEVFRVIRPLEAGTFTTLEDAIVEGDRAIQLWQPSATEPVEG